MKMVIAAARTSFLQENYSDSIKGLLSSFQEAAMIFHDDKSYSIDMVSKTYNLSQEDSKRWFESVKYSINGRISTDTSCTAIDKVSADIFSSNASSDIIRQAYHLQK